MKILMILPRIPFPVRDGGAIVMYETLRALHVAGHHVDVLALNPSKHSQNCSAIADVCTFVQSVDINTNVTFFGVVKGLVHRKFPRVFAIDSVAPYWLTRFACTEALEAVRDLLHARGTYDVIVCETLFTACYGIAARRYMTGKTATPIVLRSHNLEFRIQERLAQNGKKSLLEKLYRKSLATDTMAYEGYVGQTVDAVATMSHTDASGYRALSARAVVDVHPPGVNIPERSLVTIDDDAICLLGSLDWAPNVEGAIWFVREVYPIVRLLRPQTTVHIAGRSTPQSIKALANGESIFVHGEVLDAASFRRQHALSVVPLHSGSGIRIKILEALAQSCAVVTTTVGCEGIAVEHDCHVLIADDAEAFAHACVKVLNSHDLRTRLGVEGRLFVEAHYSWQTSINSLIEFYRAVISTVNR